MGNSDVPGPYRQDSAGDYGSADFGIGRNAGYGRAGSGRSGGRGDAERPGAGVAGSGSGASSG
ncbi:MAG: hypothetical protein M3Y33_17320, partial [Actinomycetota bacterium]|nr:hypothetical protein [Actinomycetota bacterium]